MSDEDWPPNYPARGTLVRVGAPDTKRGWNFTDPKMGGKRGVVIGLTSPAGCLDIVTHDGQIRSVAWYDVKPCAATERNLGDALEELHHALYDAGDAANAATLEGILGTYFGRAWEPPTDGKWTDKRK